MIRIDKMVRELCPGGVRYMTIGDLGTLKRGKGLTKKDLIDSGIGAVHYGQIYTRYGVWAEETISFVKPSSAERYTPVEPGDLIITNTSENIEDVGKSLAWIGKDPIITGGHATVLHHGQNPKYLSYVFQSEVFQVAKRKYCRGVKVIELAPEYIARIKIPVPPLEVQNQVVKILDTFTELEAELEARCKQYEYYRDLLLDYDSDSLRSHATLKKLGELCEISRGASPRPISKFITKDIDDSVPWIKIGDVETNSKYVTQTAQFITPDGAEKSREISPGDFILSNSMSFGRPYISKIYGCIHDGWLKLSKFEEHYLPDFLYHLLRSNAVQSQFRAAVGSGTVSNLNSKLVAQTIVPVPSLTEQERIVSILDKFDALVNDISVGLPAEIDARRKQYEHYREKLLSFEEAK